MRLYSSVCLVACAALLTACGGGGGGGRSPAPIVPLPSTPPANFDIANLTTSQTFEAIGNNEQATFDLAQGTVTRSDAQNAQLSVAYNASAKSYTVTLGGETSTFGSGNLKSNANGEAKYDKGSAATGREMLTLVTTPYFGSNTSNRYVGMGYWQRYSVTNQIQNDHFSTFVYGQRTPASATPKTGSGQYLIDVFGVATTPGYQPSVFQGDGTFSVDFLGGEFYARAYMRETELLTGNTVIGGGIDLTTSGHLASDGTFSGTAVTGTRNSSTSGTLNGSFFGPQAQEVGASFATSNAQGAHTVGSFTGKSTGQSAVNLSLLNITTPQRFVGGGMTMYYETGSIYGPDVRNQNLGGILNDKTNGNFSYGPGSSDMPILEFTDAHKVQSANENFTAYLNTFEGNDVRLHLYKVGSANKEIQLSYVTLGRWEMTRTYGVTENIVQHFYYGLPTPENVLSRRTGSANYAGVVYGSGGHKPTGDQYDVTGSSMFNVNFGDQSYTGSLALQGHRNGSMVNFGNYDFNGLLTRYGGSAPFLDAEGQRGEIHWQFYGPSGEEIGGAFYIHVQDDVLAGGALINGVTVARRQ